jgi:hypothetical protein
VGARFLGVDVAGEIFRRMGDRMIAATYTVVTPGTRGADLSAGTNPKTADHVCRGFVEEFRSEQIDGANVRYGDRIVAILGASLPAAVAPRPNDRVMIEGVTYRVIRVLSRDAGQAVWRLHGRGA